MILTNIEQLSNDRYSELSILVFHTFRRSENTYLDQSFSVTQKCKRRHAKEFSRSAARENLLGFHVVLHGDLLNDGGMLYP